MKKMKFVLIAILTFMSVNVMAMDSVATEKGKVENKVAESEEPKGKAIVSVFANFNMAMQNGVSKCGFQLDRSYVGYQYSLGKGLELKAVMDIGKPSVVDDYHYVAYIKNAQVSWKHKGLTLTGGMISTTQFNMQEKFWGYRYIYKSFQDQYKFGSSADLGLSVAYKFADWVSADVIMTNGEGYKKIQGDLGFQYGLGLTFTPVEGLSLRLYGGLNDATEAEKVNVYNYAAFVGYKNKVFSLGGEFAMMQNSGNVKSRNQLGCSVYGSVKAHKIVDVYARWDMLTSNNGWNAAKDEMAVIAGAQVKLGKYVKIAPNFRMTIPKEGENKYMAYVSCYFGL
ncbi:MAG: hypothetical protein IJY67_01220 [Paludibacteraceae bacterium]|nr:hypothetical protein [Paludibacteraceae bacterium]